MSTNTIKSQNTLIETYKQSICMLSQMMDHFDEDYYKCNPNIKEYKENIKNRLEDIKSAQSICSKNGIYSKENNIVYISDSECLWFFIIKKMIRANFVLTYLFPKIYSICISGITNELAGCSIEDVHNGVSKIAMLLPQPNNKECYTALCLLDDTLVRQLIASVNSNGDSLYCSIHDRSFDRFDNILNNLPASESLPLRVFSCLYVFELPSIKVEIQNRINELLSQGGIDIMRFMYNCSPDFIDIFNQTQQIKKRLINPEITDSDIDMGGLIKKMDKGIEICHIEILRLLENKEVHPYILKRANEIYNKYKFIFGEVQPVVSPRTEFDIPFQMKIMYELAIHAIQKEMERNKTVSFTENPDKKIVESYFVKDYMGFHAIKFPKYDYSVVRKIAAILTGQVNNTGSVKHYLRAQDVPRFCYFFFGFNDYPDNNKEVDFTNPIQWNDSWQSFKYVAYCLYGKPKPFPSNVASIAVEAFRFVLEKQRCEIKGKISEDTFNTTGNMDTYMVKTEEFKFDKKLIDTIFKEFEPFIK